MTVQILSTDIHRNGVAGTPFHIVRFTWPNATEDPTATFLAIIPTGMRNDGTPQQCGPSGGVECFVIHEGVPSIRFTENSWRGDQAYAELVEAGLWQRVDVDADTRLNESIQAIKALRGPNRKPSQPR